MVIIMITISSLDTLLYTIAAFIPGFIIDSLLRLKLTLKKRDLSFSFFRFIILSVVNYLPWSYLIFCFYYCKESQPSYLVWFLLITIIFISPIAIALLLIKLHDNKIAKFFLNICGFSDLSLNLCTWDKIFSTIKENTYVVVTLNDNSVIYGKLEKGSNIASDEDGRDIYISKTYKVENGHWDICPQTCGIIIIYNQIKHIEFFR